MYAGVPIDVPTSVIVPVRDVLWVRFAVSRDAEIALATPKSVTVADAGREQNVVRLDVAMDDAAAVRVDERARDVLEDAHRFAHGERAARQSRAQRLALDERHDEERQRRRALAARSAPARCADAAAPPRA